MAALSRDPPDRTLASLIPSSHLHGAFRTLESELSSVKLRSGETLFEEGALGDALYVVVYGRLRAVRDPLHGGQVLGEIGRGESVGEMALLTGEPRSATVYAIRNTELVRLSRVGFERMAEQQPQVMLALARLIATRYQRVIDAPVAARPASFAVVPCDPGVPGVEFAAGLVRALSLSRRVLSLDAASARGQRQDWGDATTSEADDEAVFGWLDAQELEHDHLVYVADPGPSAWTRLCLRQADVVLLVGSSGAATNLVPGLRDLFSSASDTLHARLELVHLYDSAREAPTGTAAWLAAFPVGAHHHLDPNLPRDYERLARMLTGQAIGLVLGGGGARGLAHIGVIRALNEADIPIDLVGGTSIGAVLGAEYASGWDTARMLAETRRVFIDGGSLLDFTLPVMALLSGQRYARALENLFGDRLIEDQPTTYFCVSTNLTRSTSVMHRSGLLRKWVAASMAVPGLGPPIFAGRDVLVDGGILNNLPIDVMRGLGRGPVFASSVSGSVGPVLDQDYADRPSPWRVLWSRIAPFGSRMQVPSIASILIRSTSLSNATIRARGYPGTDLVFEPPIDGHKLLDWRSLDQLEELGYRSAKTTIEAWKNAGGRTAAASHP